MYEVRLSQEARKYYQRLEFRRARQVNRWLDKLANDPFGGQDIRKLKGKLKGSYRCRVGDLRIVYSVDRRASVIWVEGIGSRGKAY